MSESAIKVENLSKVYHIGAHKKLNRTFREALVETVSGPFRRAGRLLGGRSSGAADLDESFLALDKVSFDVKRGEVLGVIGRNGAGKSTLLKILSRITEPTEGTATIYGHVGSLLEVGTGFHPELTGRENVYLNGSILGMKKSRIAEKFDAIVEFAEVEKFIDTPVKHYSSGMYTRLAFAVAAHLEPEILIVDEVLAVGDAQFQKKCLGKMQDVAHAGRTVLFVSHNMGAIQSLCSHAILLRQGQLLKSGPTGEVVQAFLSNLNQVTGNAFEDNPERSGTGRIRLTGARIYNAQGQTTQSLVAGESATVELDYVNPNNLRQMDVVVTILNHLGVCITSFATNINTFEVADIGKQGRIQCHLPDVPLPPGQYRLAAALQLEGETADLVPNAIIFDIISSVFYKGGKTPDSRYCLVMVHHEWKHLKGE
jgi:lipopolysaccharide transport system ATP-binding protein